MNDKQRFKATLFFIFTLTCLFGSLYAVYAADISDDLVGPMRIYQVVGIKSIHTVEIPNDVNVVSELSNMPQWMTIKKGTNSLSFISTVLESGTYNCSITMSHRYKPTEDWKGKLAKRTVTKEFKVIVKDENYENFTDGWGGDHIAKTFPIQ